MKKYNIKHLILLTIGLFIFHITPYTGKSIIDGFYFGLGICFFGSFCILVFEPLDEIITWKSIYPFAIGFPYYLITYCLQQM